MRALLLFVAGAWVAGCSGTHVGDACRKHTDCEGLASAYCARAEACTRECSDAAPCPKGSSCVAMGGRSVCLRSCTKDSECIATFTCQAVADVQVCAYAAPLGEPPK